VSEDGAHPNEMNEVALFRDALRAAVPAQPDRELAASIVPRLAATARSSTIEAEARTSRPTERLRSAGPRWRRPVVAVAIAIALIPVLLAGLAVAGVTVPRPARDAFDSVGISLPNQPSHHHAGAEGRNGQPSTSPAQGGNEVSGVAHAKPKGAGGNSAAAHEHAHKRHQKAGGHAKKTPPGQTRVPPGQAKTPPGQASTPPGQAKKTPSAQAPEPSGQSETPPGQSKTPPGQSKTPPGQSK
jgi:hypothetical protein